MWRFLVCGNGSAERACDHGVCARTTRYDLDLVLPHTCAITSTGCTARPGYLAGRDKHVPCTACSYCKSLYAVGEQSGSLLAGRWVALDLRGAALRRDNSATRVVGCQPATCWSTGWHSPCVQLCGVNTCVPCFVHGSTATKPTTPWRTIATPSSTISVMANGRG